MTDENFSPNSGGAVPSAVPAPSTSLSADAHAAKTQIEAWMAEGPNGTYWKGNEHHSAAFIRETYAGLIRGEQQGARDAVGPAFEPDRDMPLSIRHYDFQDVGRSFQAEDRDILDQFLPHAFEGGLGQEKVRQAISWTMSVPGLTPDAFRKLAIGAGWSNQHIETCLKFHNQMTKG
jgi:hypothetical protein